MKTFYTPQLMLVAYLTQPKKYFLKRSALPNIPPSLRRANVPCHLCPHVCTFEHVSVFYQWECWVLGLGKADF